MMLDVMDYVLIVGVLMAAVAMCLAIYVTIIVHNLAADILDQLDAKIIEEVVESTPTQIHGPESPAFRGYTRVHPNGVVQGDSIPDDLPPPTVHSRHQLPTHAEQIERTMKRA